MDIAGPTPASNALTEALDKILTPGPSEVLYLDPIFREAIAAANASAAAAQDSKTTLVARATRDNLERTFAQRRSMVVEPLASSYAIRDLLRSCVAGQDLSPA